MIVINFSHPLTAKQQLQIELLTGQHTDDVLTIPAQFDNDKPFVPQLDTLLELISLTPAEWQTEAIIVNPPALSAIAVLVLAELHGRMGYFPPVLRMARTQNTLRPRFDVAEIINLQEVRDAARKTRD